MNLANTPARRMAILLVCSAAVLLAQTINAQESPPTVAELSESVHAAEELEAQWRAALAATVAQLKAGKIPRQHHHHHHHHHHHRLYALIASQDAFSDKDLL